MYIYIYYIICIYILYYMYAGGAPYDSTLSLSLSPAVVFDIQQRCRWQTKGACVCRCVCVHICLALL